MRDFYEFIENSPVYIAVGCGLAVLVSAAAVVVTSTLRAGGIL